jgi:hypothetical protein
MRGSTRAARPIWRVQKTRTTSARSGSIARAAMSSRHACMSSSEKSVWRDLIRRRSRLAQAQNGSSGRVAWTPNIRFLSKPSSRHEQAVEKAE